MAAAITSLPWVSDGISEGERQAVQELIDSANQFPRIFPVLVAKPWVEDGVNEAERNLMADLRSIARTDEVAAIKALDVLSLGTIDGALIMLAAYTELFTDVLGRPWVEDGLNESERVVLTRLGEIATKDRAAAQRILEMPFLESVEAVDAGAMQSLWHLASWQRQAFQEALSHPSLSAGITDEWAKVVVVLGIVRDDTPALLDALLDPDQVTLEERTINLPLAGEIDLAIVRTRPGSEQSMDMLERVVRGAEAFMGEPLPVGYVTVLFEESIGTTGFNAQTYIAARARTDDGERALGILSHEVNHYYWTGNHGWVNEGAATFLSRALRGYAPAQWAEPYSFPFRFASNLAELERLLSEGSDRPYLSLANYRLGHRIFADLYRNLGDEAFREGFRNLYLMSEGVQGGIDELKDAFKASAPESATVIDTIAARWYDGTELYDLSYQDATQVDPSLPSINGRVDRAYVALGQDGTPASRFSTQEGTGDLWFSLEYSHEHPGDPPPLHLEIVEFFEDGFVFRRQQVAVDPSAVSASQTHQLAVGIAAPEGTEADLVSLLWTEYVPHGRYWVYVYHEGRKVAEVEYEVVP